MAENGWWCDQEPERTAAATREARKLHAELRADHPDENTKVYADLLVRLAELSRPDGD